jgi:linoleoyl-CoA desaturase
MQTIRYQASEASQRQFAQAVRRNVNAYFKDNDISPKADGRFAVKTVVMLAFYFVPFVVLLALQLTGWWALLTAVVMGVGLAGIGMGVMHDGVHGSVSNKGWVNRLVGGSMYILGGSAFTWKVQHNMAHHTHTNIDEVDGDIASRGPLRFCEHAPLKWIHRFQFIHAFFFYGLMTFTKVFNDFGKLHQANVSGVTKSLGKDPRRMWAELLLAKTIYFAFIFGLPLWLTPLTFAQVFVGFFIMHFVSGFILGVVFQLAHVVELAQQPLPDADGVIHDDWVVHEMRTTANFAPGSALLSWYTGGLNHQVEHHLFPHICHVHYRAIAPIVERTALEHGVPYNSYRTFGTAMASHIRRLKELGRPKDVSVGAVAVA